MHATLVECKSSLERRANQGMRCPVSGFPYPNRELRMTTWAPIRYHTLATREVILLAQWEQVKPWHPGELVHRRRFEDIQLNMRYGRRLEARHITPGPRLFFRSNT